MPEGSAKTESCWCGLTGFRCPEVPTLDRTQTNQQAKVLTHSERGNERIDASLCYNSEMGFE